MSKELLIQARDALASCRIGGYKDIDGDFCATYRFDKKLIETALAALQAAIDAPEDEPEFFTVFASHGDGFVPLPGYSNETEHGVKDLVLTSARKEGYKGTVSGRLLELGWVILPVFSRHSAPQKPAAPAWMPIPAAPK